jgi:hypothetical protein
MATCEHFRCKLFTNRMPLYPTSRDNCASLRAFAVVGVALVGLVVAPGVRFVVILNVIAAVGFLICDVNLVQPLELSLL